MTKQKRAPLNDTEEDAFFGDYGWRPGMRRRVKRRVRKRERRQAKHDIRKEQA